MDITFTEEQEMLRKSARDFLAAESPRTKVTELEEDDRGYSPEVWDKMAALGWMGLAIPEEYDGMGMSYQDLTILLEEMGRNVLPGPFGSQQCPPVAVMSIPLAKMRGPRKTPVSKASRRLTSR